MRSLPVSSLYQYSAGGAGAHHLDGPHSAAPDVPHNRAEHRGGVGGWPNKVARLHGRAGPGHAQSWRWLLRFQQARAQAEQSGARAGRQNSGAGTGNGSGCAATNLAGCYGSGTLAGGWRPALVWGRCLTPTPWRAGVADLRLHSESIGFSESCCCTGVKSGRRGNLQRQFNRNA